MSADEYRASQKKTNSSVILDANQKACINNIINNLGEANVSCFPNAGVIQVHADFNEDKNGFNDGDAPNLLWVDNIAKEDLSRYYLNKGCNSSYLANGLYIKSKKRFLYADDIRGLPEYVMKLVHLHYWDQDKAEYETVLTASDAATICSTWNKINNFIKAH